MSLCSWIHIISYMVFLADAIYSSIFQSLLIIFVFNELIVHIGIYIWVCTYIHIIYTYMHTCIHIYIHIYIYIYIYIYTYFSRVITRPNLTVALHLSLSIINVFSSSSSQSQSLFNMSIYLILSPSVSYTIIFHKT